MKTKIILLLTACLIFLLDSCLPGKVINGNGDIVTETIAVSDYKRIKAASGNMEIRYTQSADAPYLQVKTDRNIYDMYTFEVDDNGILQIKPRNKYRNNYNFRPTVFLITAHSSTLEKVELAGSTEFYTDSPLITEELVVELSGSGDINLQEKVTTNRLGVSIAGSATLNVAEVYCNQFKGEIAGSGRMNIGGEAVKANFDVAGSGKIRAFDLQVDDLKCNVAGSGNIEASVKESIDVSAVGSGKVRYKGNPATINRNIIGSGSIIKVED